MYKLEFTLKQHTPLIHFQHDQDGATLRASEVKPKLDRFLIKKLQLTEIVHKAGKDIEVPKPEYKSWFNSEDHLSLDYKFKIVPNIEQKIKIEPRHTNSPMYFANLGNKPGDKEKFKHFKITDNEIPCFIFSFNTLKVNNETLLEVIQKNIYEFFFQNNFGTRQSKGYGSFEVIKIDSKSLDKNQKKKGFNYQIKLSNASNWEAALSQVSYFYKALRGGINLIDKKNYSNPQNKNNQYYLDLKTTSKYYVKPLIFLFAKSIGHQWDKKTIKQTYLGSDVIRKFNNSRNEKQEFIMRFTLTEAYINANKRNFFVNEVGLNVQLINHNNSDVLSFNSATPVNGCYYNFKDLFGLSSEESWKSYDKTVLKENVERSSISRAINIKNKRADDYIDRFKSPLLFKLIKEEKSYDVYIILEDLPNEYIGSKYSVHPKSVNSNLVLEIPKFQFVDFFNFIADTSKFDYNSYLPKLSYDKKNQNLIDKYEEPEKINSTLETFFSQIQNQTSNAKK